MVNHRRMMKEARREANVCELARGCESIVEIGVYLMQLSMRLWRLPGLKELHLVDPYDQALLFKAIAAADRDKWPQDRLDRQAHNVATFARKMTEESDVNVVFHHQTSLNAARQFVDHSMDMVYIDGNHQYEFVCEDIRAWLPKVRSGGILSGDDHDYERVANAVRDTLGDVEVMDDARTWHLRVS